MQGKDRESLLGQKRGSAAALPQSIPIPVPPHSPALGCPSGAPDAAGHSAASQETVPAPRNPQPGARAGLSRPVPLLRSSEAPTASCGTWQGGSRLPSPVRQGRWEMPAGVPLQSDLRRQDQSKHDLCLKRLKPWILLVLIISHTSHGAGTAALRAALESWRRL